MNSDMIVVLVMVVLFIGGLASIEIQSRRKHRNAERRAEGKAADPEQ